jgi:hypothetical protein
MARPLAIALLAWALACGDAPDPADPLPVDPSPEPPLDPAPDPPADPPADPPTDPPAEPAACALVAPTDLTTVVGPMGPAGVPQPTLLVWTDTSSGQARYEVHRSVAGSAGTFSLLATTEFGASSYADTAPVGTDGASCLGCAYRVRAFTDACTSGFSNVAVASAPPPGPAPPGPQPPGPGGGPI